MVRNQRLINEVAVSVVWVQGPTADLQMNLSEIITSFAYVQEGLEWMATLEPDAKVSWVYQNQWVNIDEKPWPNAPWKGLPREFYQKKIDAALWRESNKKIYFFNKDQYVRLTGTTMDSGYPKPIAGNWNGLPPAFEEGIDAAFWRKTNDKIYMFKDDQYVRLTGSTVDSGYPKPIAGNWNGLPSAFEAGIDAVFMHHGTNKIYMLKGDQYVRLTGSTVDNNYPKTIKGNFKGLPEHMEDGIHSALWRGSNDKVYFFSKPSRRTLTDYVRFSNINQPIDANYPKYVGGHSKNEAEALWRDPAQAELGVGPGADGYKDYVDEIRQNLGTEWGVVAFITKYPLGWSAYAGTPKIVMAWKDHDNFGRVFAHEMGHMFGAPDEYSSSKCSCSSTYGRFFRAVNGNCKLCSKQISMDNDYPRQIAGNWKNLAVSFRDNIDAVVWRDSNEKVYMFKGNQYIRLTSTTMDTGYPKPIAGNWKGLPGNFQQGIDAALWRKSNNKIYMFRGNQYVRFTGSTMDAGYPKNIAGNWKELPGNFQQGIDAALWREANNKIYMFKGNQYVRFTGSTMDAGYPNSIAGNWKGLPASFTNGFGAALMHREKEKIYLFDNDEYVRMSNGVPCLMASNSDQLCDYTPLHIGWGAFLTNINAAVWRGDNEKTYLFSGKWYVRYTDIGDGIDENYPRLIAGNWKGLPGNFQQGIDAALWRDSNKKLYFFKGNQYVRLTGSTMDAGYPKPIAGNWNGLPGSFQQGIDAAIWRESNSKIYIFKGNQYARLTGSTMDAGYPRPIAGNWPDLPAGFQSGINAALMRWNTNKIYFFKNRTYIRYSSVSEGIDSGYPKWINKNWMPFPT